VTVLSNGGYVIAGKAREPVNSQYAVSITVHNADGGFTGPVTSANSLVRTIGTAYNPYLIVDDLNNNLYVYLYDEHVYVGSKIDGFAHRWHFTAKPQDVDNDGHIVAQDVVAVINYINAHGSGSVPNDGKPVTTFCDVTGDDYIAADDVVKIINYINAHPGENEAAEQEGPASSQSTSTIAQPPDVNQQVPEALLLLLANDNATAKRRK
jgi:hypothetical protein